MTETASETAVLDQERKERKMEGTEADSILRLNIEPCLAVPLLLSLPFSCVCFVEPIAMRPTFVRLAKLRTALTRSER